MTFLSRENRQPMPITPYNENQANFGRGRNSVDQTQMDSKLSKQEIYRLELQQQIKVKEERKRQQLQSIKREDERFMRETEEIKRKEKERLGQERQKQQKLFQENISLSPNLKKQSTLQQQRVSRILNSSNPHIQQPKQSELSRYNFARGSGDMNKTNEPEHQFQRQRPIEFEEYQQNKQYYEQRVKRHKQEMDFKLEQLFKHIHSTKDNIKADEEIEKIKRRIRSKQVQSQSFAGAYQGDAYQSNFYQIPKKQNQQHFPSHQNQSRVLDYQSKTKFTSSTKIDGSRSKIKTQYGDTYKISSANQTERKMQRWGTRPTEGRYGIKEALDFQIAKTLEGIDQFQDYLKKKGE